MNNNILKNAKRVAILLIMAGSFSSCEREEISPDKFRLVKTLYYNKSTSATPTDGIEYSYDMSGNMVKESYVKYNPTSLYMYREYEYSGKKKIKMKFYSEENGKFIMGKYIDFFYDSNDQLIREDICNSSGIFLSSMNYEYSGKNMIREYFFEPDYGISEEVKYTFDSKNRLIKEEFATVNVKDVKYIKHIYDNNDRKIKIEYSNLNGDLIRSVEIIYNGRSKLPVQDLHYDSNGNQTAQYQHNYDRKGNLIETRFVDGCSLFKRKYDGGLLIEEILYSGKEKNCTEDEMKRYEYEKI